MFNRFRRENNNSGNTLVQKASELNEIMISDYKSVHFLRENAKNYSKKKYLFDPCVGRDAELRNLIITLNMPQNSSILTGPPGVGKTSLVDGLAYKIQRGEVPKYLKNVDILELSSFDFTAGNSLSGTVEAVTKCIIRGLRVLGPQRAILFIDEMHGLIGAGHHSSNTTNDVANMIKGPLARGDIKIIGATTSEEYDRHIHKEAAFRRRFERVSIDEPNEELLWKILKQKVIEFSSYYSIKFECEDEIDVILKAILIITSKDNRNEKDLLFNPDLAIKLLAKGFSSASVDGHEYLKVEHILSAASNDPRLNNKIKKEIGIALTNSNISLNLNLY